MTTTTKNFRIADIRVLGQHRPLVKEKVRMLADRRRGASMLKTYENRHAIASPD
jgi:hypothetical protein